MVKAGASHKINVSADGKTTADIESKNVILATGAKPRSFPGLEPDGKNIWTSREAMIAEKRPESLLVIGSGAIGIEFANFYNTMGTKVTVVEVMDRILPVEDKDISDMALKAFQKQGMEIHTRC